MGKRKKILIITLCIAAALAAAAAAGFYAYRYFSLCSRNTRALEARLSETGLNGEREGRVGELLDLDYDRLYVFAPYETKERMELQIGFKTSVLKECVSEHMINYLFVKDGKPAAYLYGYPENIGYCINLKNGYYLKSQLDAMEYEVQTLNAGNSSGKETTYQDYNFYFKDTIEQPVSNVVVQTGNAVTAVPVGEEITVNLSRDSRDTVRYALKGDDGTDTEFIINGEDYGSELKDKLITPSSKSYYIVDLVADDDYKEIAIADLGPSFDPETFFFRYVNGNLIYLGSITDLPDSDTCHFQNQGSSQGEIVAAYRLGILQTWFGQGYWKLNKNNRLEFQEQSVYYPVREYKAVLLKELTVYEERSLESIGTQMPPGEVTFLATDNKEWVQIEDKNGTQGWFYIRNRDTIADAGISSEETVDYFEGLEIYD